MDHLVAVCLESCSSWGSHSNVKHTCICARLRHMTLVSTFKAFLVGILILSPFSPSLSQELVTHTHFVVHRKYSEKANSNPTIKIPTRKLSWTLPYIFFSPLKQGLIVYPRLVLSSQSSCLKFPNAGVTGVCHDDPQISEIFKSKFGGFAGSQPGAPGLSASCFQSFSFDGHNFNSCLCIQNVSHT